MTNDDNDEEKKVTDVDDQFVNLAKVIGIEEARKQMRLRVLNNKKKINFDVGSSAEANAEQEAKIAEDNHDVIEGIVCGLLIVVIILSLLMVKES